MWLIYNRISWYHKFAKIVYVTAKFSNSLRRRVLLKAGPRPSGPRPTARHGPAAQRPEGPAARGPRPTTARRPAARDGPVAQPSPDFPRFAKWTTVSSVQCHLSCCQVENVDRHSLFIRLCTEPDGGGKCILKREYYQEPMMGSCYYLFYFIIFKRQFEVENVIS